jgi:hypothetical protein
MNKVNVKKVVKALGGSARTARFFNIKTSSVSEWISNDRIPKARLLHLQHVRPDIFDTESKTKTNNHPKANNA